MRFVIATDSFAPKIDGVADTASILAANLVGRGHSVRVMAPAPGPARYLGYHVLRVPALGFPLYRELRVAVRNQWIGRSLKRRPPDALVVLTPGPIGISALRAAPASVKVVNIYTTDILQYARSYRVSFVRPAVRRLLKWMSSRSAATLYPTEHAGALLAALGCPRLIQWGRGADLELFDPERRSHEMRNLLSGGEPEKPIVLYVGRLAREKRLLDLLEPTLALQGARFAFVGDGPQRALLERKFRQVPAVFTGFLRGVSLAEAFASADVFVFPSVSETFGQVVLQAMASALPPIVVAGSAPAEYVPNGVAGCHVPPRDPPALVAALRELLANQGLRERMGAAARLEARRHQWPDLVSRLEAVASTPIDAASTPASGRCGSAAACLP